MPQAIHESTAFNSRNRKVAIHCVFSVKDNTHNFGGVFLFCTKVADLCYNNRNKVYKLRL